MYDKQEINKTGKFIYDVAVELKDYYDNTELFIEKIKNIESKPKLGKNRNKTE